MVYARISGTGSYLPKKILTNQDLEKIVETSDQWIQERTGIKQRHIVAEGESTTDLALVALERALESAGKTADELDLIIVATCTQQSNFPSTAARLQNRLNIHTIPAFDVNAACSGFIYALDIANKYMNVNTRCIAVIGAESMSSIVNWDDRGTCVLFGDGAGAVILEPSEEQGILSTHIHADGRYEDLLSHNATSGFLEMRGNEVFKFAVKTLGQIVDETLAANNLSKNDIDWLIPHQANLRIISATAKKLDMPMEQVILTVDHHGNTSAASIPLALDIGVQDGRIKRDQILLMEAFGGGFTWGSALVKF